MPCGGWNNHRNRMVSRKSRSPLASLEYRQRIVLSSPTSLSCTRGGRRRDRPAGRPARVLTGSRQRVFCPARWVPDTSPEQPARGRGRATCDLAADLAAVNPPGRPDAGNAGISSACPVPACPVQRWTCPVLCTGHVQRGTGRTGHVQKLVGSARFRPVLCRDEPGPALAMRHGGVRRAGRSGGSMSVNRLCDRSRLFRPLGDSQARCHRPGQHSGRER